MRPFRRFAALAALLGLATHLGGSPAAPPAACGQVSKQGAPRKVAGTPAVAVGASAPEILLWPHGAPGPKAPVTPEASYRTDQGERVVTHVPQPTLTPFLPPAAAATGVAVLILPGGGHRELWLSHEGDNPAAWFAAHGVAAFVVKYRLAREAQSPYTVDQDELGDVQRALRLVKSRAAEWQLDTAKVGVLGFSAGGELAGLAAMRFTSPTPHAPDPVDRLSDRPAFQVLLYPGNSGRLAVSRHAPPVFIAGGYLDRPDIDQGMAQLYLKYQQRQVPAELHIYAGVGHGFGLRTATEGAVAEWPRQVRLWLQEIGCLQKERGSTGK
ncbi:MAG: alpha/beta hydrolase [Janthinobacterium lividum]